MFLKAARLVVDAVPDAHAIIVGDTADGDPAYRDELETMCRELGIAERTTFTGYQSDIASLMRASDVLVHASTKAEPFGTVILEGMSCGRPYVAMNEGGPPEMIESAVHGLLVGPNQPDEMARADSHNPERTQRRPSAFGSAARARSVRAFLGPDDCEKAP